MTTTFEQRWSVTTPASIAAFEQKTGLQLPESYRRFLLTTNGGAPTPKIATVKDQGRVMIGRFFGLRTLQELDEVSEMGDIAWLHSDLCDVMPSGFLPIADDPGREPVPARNARRRCRASLVLGPGRFLV